MNNKIKEKIKNQAKESVKEELVEFVKEGEKAGYLDVFLGKLISRKLLTFGAATALLYSGSLDSEQWGLIAIVYIGGQAVIDAAKVWRHG